jgi:hypothetical protein
MPGRSLRLFAAIAALTLLGISAASAGWYGGCCAPPAPPVANWGCATSGCAPLLPSFSSAGCCAPVRWGCGNPCGPSYATGAYGISEDYAPAPIHVVPQGPLYSPPLTGYTYPVYSGDEGYPPGYGRGYSGYPRIYRPYRYGWRHRYVGPRVAHWAPSYYRVRHYGPRYGVPYRYYRGYPLRVRGQASPNELGQ